jgi:RND family efflux transporter MFP subunit
MSWRAVLGLLAVVGCGSGAQTAAPPPPPPSLQSALVERVRVEEPIQATGSVVAEKTTEIGPRVDGIVEEIRAQVGDRVQAGQPLFRTRLVDYRLRLDEAEAALRLTTAEAEKSVRDRERARSLQEQGVLSRERLDQVETAHRISQARVETARAGVALARQALADAVVCAPYAGVVTRRYIDEGAMLRTMMGGGSAVLQLMKTDVVLAIVQVPETQLPRVQVGTPVRVRIDGLDRVFESRVAVVNDRVEAASRSIEVRIALANPDLVIKPGLSAVAEILPEARPALALQRSALLGAADARFVYVPEEGRARRRAVEVRDLDAARVEVVSGLEAGERVLVGQDVVRLAEGSPVRVEGADGAG